MNMNDATGKGNDESHNVMTRCQHCADDLDRTNGQILTLVLRLPLRYVDAVSVPPRRRTLGQRAAPRRLLVRWPAKLLEDPCRDPCYLQSVAPRGNWSSREELNFTDLPPGSV